MRMSKEEKKTQQERMKAARDEAQNALNTNTCPLCGNSVYVNTSLTGWIQCNGYPAVSHRKPGHEKDAKCNWQGFLC